MNPDEVDALAARIKEILLGERDLLVSGQAADALALAEDKSQAIEQFEAIVRSPHSAGSRTRLRKHLTDISKISKENELHFIAVRNGVRNLIVRLEDLGQSTSAGIYNQYGDGVRFSGSVGGYEKKV